MVEFEKYRCVTLPREYNSAVTLHLKYNGVTTKCVNSNMDLCKYQTSASLTPTITNLDRSLAYPDTELAVTGTNLFLGYGSGRVKCRLGPDVYGEWVE